MAASPNEKRKTLDTKRAALVRRMKNENEKGKILVSYTIKVCHSERKRESPAGRKRQQTMEKNEN
jgi:hypothetical protein